MRRLKSAATLAALTLPVTALHAQAYQCRTPSRVEAPPNIQKPAKERRRLTPIAGYTLALSWSPEFCKGRKGARKHKMQCSGSNGDFGFILHGLWPETQGSSYPQWCKATRPLRPDVIRKNTCMMPSSRLQQHEWAKHGSCMSKRPETYFRISRLLYGAIRYPDMYGLSRTPLTVRGLREKFAAENQGLKPDMIAVKLTRNGWLSEVRLCLGKSFKPRRCPSHMSGARNVSKVKVWRGS